MGTEFDIKEFLKAHVKKIVAGLVSTAVASAMGYFGYTSYNTKTEPQIIKQGKLPMLKIEK